MNTFMNQHSSDAKAAMLLTRLNMKQLADQSPATIARNFAKGQNFSTDIEFVSTTKLFAKNEKLVVRIGEYSYSFKKSYSIMRGYGPTKGQWIAGQTTKVKT